jgi:hypothetical protein
MTDHDDLVILRHLVRDLLLRPADVSPRVGAGAHPPAEALAALEAACGSELERAFLCHLHAGGYRLPNHAGAVVQGCGTRPDFYWTR